METWLPSTYACIKKAFFSSHPKTKVSCLASSGQPSPFVYVAVYLNIIGTLTMFIMPVLFCHSTFLFKTLQESQVKMNHLLLHTDHKLLMKSRYMYMKALYNSTNITSSSDKFCFDLLILVNISINGYKAKDNI